MLTDAILTSSSVLPFYNQFHKTDKCIIVLEHELIMLKALAIVLAAMSRILSFLHNIHRSLVETIICHVLLYKQFIVYSILYNKK